MLRHPTAPPTRTMRGSLSVHDKFVCVCGFQQGGEDKGKVGNRRKGREGKKSERVGETSSRERKKEDSKGKIGE